jgi:predicted transposase YdaD
MQPHDHNFKNIFLDFPKEALSWLLPEALDAYGQLERIEFVRQEPRKRKLSEAHLSLDMPILFTFAAARVLLWLVEFQEDKQRFSIYRLLRYTTDLMEAYPDATVVPTVLFTQRKKWRRDVPRQIESHLGNRQFLRFEYRLIRLFDFQARDYYDHPNPIVRILLPKMNYKPEERAEVIRQAYLGLFRLAAPMLFDKYVDFIDVYAEIREEEREEIYHLMTEREESAMLAQYIKDKGFQEGRKTGQEEGRRKGRLEGRHEGRLEGKCGLLEMILTRRFGPLPDWAKQRLASASSEQLDQWAERALEVKSLQDVWVE